MVATITDKSFITSEIGKEVSGFHCHTYGKFSCTKMRRPIIVSHAKRVNYHKDPQDLISGVANKQGNVVGIFIHALLDQNPTIIESITKSLGINAVELEEIRKVNAKLQEQMKGEIGIATNIQQQAPLNQKTPRLLMVTAMESGSGKTFMLAGIAGALKKSRLQGWSDQSWRGHTRRSPIALPHQRADQALLVD